MPQLSPALFHGHHFDRLIIILCVRLFITYKLSYRDLVEMVAERGVGVSHTTILRWVQRYVPEFDKCWNRYARPDVSSWRVDETYIRVRRRWTYLYRTVDKQGFTVDFLVSEHRDILAAKHFFTRAIELQGAPEKIALDDYPATHVAIIKLKNDGVLRPETKVWTSKYLNNLVEQDHRRIKQRTYPMFGFKSFGNAAVTISGIELAPEIRKGQFDTSAVTTKQGTRVPQVWDAVLAT